MSNKNKSLKYRLVDSVLLIKNIIFRLLSFLPFPEQKDIVFVIGCGRSGTTILGECISKHHDVKYLNEYRYIWSSIYRQTDIWSRFAKTRGGRVSNINTTPAQNKRLRRVFWLHRVMHGKKVLVEKLPINTLRKGFIDSVFPSAKYIVIERNMEEVVRSIVRMNIDERWAGHEGYKIKALISYAKSKPIKLDALNSLKSKADFAILEWVVCDMAIQNDFSTNISAFKINYDDLNNDAINTLSSVFNYLSIKLDDNALNFAKENIKRRSGKVNEVDPQYANIKNSLI